jgi:hypothetical protein
MGTTWAIAISVGACTKTRSYISSAVQRLSNCMPPEANPGQRRAPPMASIESRPCRAASSGRTFASDMSYTWITLSNTKMSSITGLLL